MILDFLKTAANLKKISRQGWINKLSLDSPESVADQDSGLSIDNLFIHPCLDIFFKFAAVLRKSNIILS